MAEALRAAAEYRPDPNRPPLVLSLPFEGPWLAVNSPARRVPSHGTHFLGQTYAIDFVAVDARGRTGTVVDWRTVLATEPVDRFVGYGAPILAPADGLVALVQDGEPDHEARRSPVTMLPYLLTQGSRLRCGLGAITGNHLILALAEDGPYVALVHLRPGSLRVAVGDRQRRTADRGLRQLRKLHPAARPHAGDGFRRPADDARAADGIPRLLRLAARRQGPAELGQPGHPRPPPASRAGLDSLTASGKPVRGYGPEAATAVPNWSPSSAAPTTPGLSWVKNWLPDPVRPAPAP